MMHSPEELLALYEQKFTTGNFPGSPPGLYLPVNHIMSIKGKRIRPLLLLMACDLFGGNVNAALNPSFAVEVFHNFSLVHDDIMDNADIRRGIPTVHKKFGLNAGILAGDVMLSFAYKYLADVPHKFIPELLHVFNKTAIEIFEGQQMDMDFEKRTEVGEAEYLKMIEFKTSVLLGCSLHLGAILGDAKAEDQKLINDFGLQLGLAFQIKDDYLDTFGEAEKVGKRIGGDILQNKKTYLYVAAMNRANEEQNKQLLSLLHETNEERKINTVKQLYETTGARQQTLNKSEEFYQLALKALDKITISSERKKPLQMLADKINRREF